MGICSYKDTTYGEIRFISSISGHWDHYKEGMFVLGDEENDKEVFALRPMTCPFQYYVYKASQKSYRDLPLQIR